MEIPLSDEELQGFTLYPSMLDRELGSVVRLLCESCNDFVGSWEYSKPVTLKDLIESASEHISEYGKKYGMTHGEE